MEEKTYTFDSFIVGASNASAFAAAKEAAEATGARRGPLLIWGRSGLGKTHLLHAVAEFVSRNDPPPRVLLTTGEQLTRRIVEQATANRAMDWAEEFRGVELLLIDDVHELAGKTMTQEVFAAALRIAEEGGSRVVLTSSAPPEATPVLIDRLQAACARFHMAEIRSPEPELVRAVAAQNADRSGLRLSEAALDYIADHAAGGLRWIEGVMRRLRAERALMGRELAEEDVTSIVDILRP